MEVNDFYKTFPSEAECLKRLEAIRWNNIPTCPTCKHSKYSPLKGPYKYHCNLCNRTFSVTSKTTFHKTQTDLRKWLYVLWKIYMKRSDFTMRELGEDLGVTKDTANLIVKKIRNSTAEQREFLNKITETLWRQY